MSFAKRYLQIIFFSQKRKRKHFLVKLELVYEQKLRWRDPTVDSSNGRQEMNMG